MIGKKISHYTILGRLGAGGMGEVYRARDEKLGREVALKVLPPEFTSDEKRIARFQREAKLASQLSHADIATIYEADEADGQHFISMELVPDPGFPEIADALEMYESLTGKPYVPEDG